MPRFENAAPILRVDDMARSLRYYLAVLGFSNAPWGSEDFTHVSRDAAGLYLSRRGQGRPGTWVWIGVEDVTALHEEYLRRGAVVHHPPRNYPWACEMKILDPDGHVLRFGSEPLDGVPFQDGWDDPPSPSALVNVWVSRFNAADPDAIAALYAEDAVNHQMPEAPVRGRLAIREMFAREFAAAKMVCIVERVHEDGNYAILEWRDPRGLRGCGFFCIEGGLIVEQRGYWDKLSFLRAYDN